MVVFYQYVQIPKNTTFDEIEFTKLALHLGKQGYTPYSTLATGHATLYFYLILLSFKIWGVSLMALRLPAAIFGVFNTILVYLIFKMVFRTTNYQLPTTKILPFLLALTFLSMRWYFNFARFGFEVTFLLFLELTSLYYMLRYKNTNTWTHLFISGLFSGLAYNSYQPGRIYFIIPFFFLLSSIMTAKRPPTQWSLAKCMLVFFTPIIILAAPLTFYLMKNPDIRIYQQFYPNNHEMTVQEKGDFFLRNLSSTAGIFNIKGDVNGRHNYPNKPALNPILGVLFVAGLIIALINYKDKYNQLFLFWFFLSLAPTLVTYPWENPNMLRTFTAIPSIVYFVGLTIVWISNFEFIHGALKKKLLLAIMFFLLGISSIYEVRTYFIHQSEVFKEAFEAERSLKSYLK